MKVNKLDNSSDLIIKITLVTVLIALAVFGRLLPHPANFAPIAALAIFGGAILPRTWAVFLPLTAMILSDLVIGLHSLVLFTWGGFAIVALLSNLWMRKINFLNIGLASMGASVFFYLFTNLGVWMEGRLYMLNFEGLISCYYNALPFFRNTLLGDLAYSALLFGAYAFVYKVVLSRKGQLKLNLSNNN